jgi:hypothetical protein
MRMKLINERPSSAAKVMIVCALAVLAFTFAGRAHGQGAAQGKPAQKQVDPKAWGGNHVGKPVVEFVHGEECLFCHRNDIGPTWQNNAHGVTVRQREGAPELSKMLESLPALATAAKEVDYFLGSRHRIRFLKKDGYGKFTMLNAQAVLGGKDQPVKLVDQEKLNWDKDKFANSCAGCHTTAVDPETKAFSEFGLDCYTCHGSVDLNHTKDTSLILLSKKRRSDAKMIISICAQCHLRDTKSASTGLPYPNNFVAGDNVFQDLVVDWAKADDPKMNGRERHVWRVVREVALNGNESMTCLNCHSIHGNPGLGNSSQKHQRVARSPICAECHAGEGFDAIKRADVHSSLCEY